MKFNITNPCTADWNKMKIGIQSRHCIDCNKDVIDFTKKSRDEILNYLITNLDKRICGHISRSQLDFTSQEILITIRNVSRSTKNRNLPFYLLTLSSLILVSCDSSPKMNSIAKSQINPDTISSNINVDTSSVFNNQTNKINCKKDTLPSIPDDIIIEGEIILEPEPIEEGGPFTIVDTMPEFPGGIDSLINYLHKNIEYPEWEKENKIEGKVFVNFIIDKNGNIKEPRILRSVPNSKNLDAEVIRVIQTMPNWTPGIHQGENVDVYFNLPVNFKL